MALDDADVIIGSYLNIVECKEQSLYEVRTSSNIRSYLNIVECKGSRIQYYINNRRVVI